MAQTKVKLISDGVIVQGNLHASHGITTAHIGEGSNLYYTDARVGSYLSTNSFATESYVGTQIANLVDSSPSALNTLNELAAALGDDANFSTTVTNSIALKAPLASPSFTGNATFAGTVTFNDHTTHPDQVSSYFGTGNDASIQHNGGHLFIDNSVGSTYLRNTSTGDILLRNSTGGDIQFDNEFAGNILFNTSNIERFRINAQGQTWLGGSGYTGSNIANGNTSYLNNLNAGAFSILHRNSSDAYIHFNTYYTSSNTYVSKYTGIGMMVGVNAAANDGMFFSKAPSASAGGVHTFSNVMQIGYGANNNVGIGTTSPDEKLSVDGNIFLQGNDDYIAFNTSASSGHPKIKMNTDADFSFLNTAGSNIFHIENGGNVGIGTASPSKKLHVKESDSATAVVKIENTIAGGDYMVMIGDAGDNVFEFDSSGTGGEALMKMYSDGVLKAQIAADGNSYFNGGNVGIGETSPDDKLHVSGGNIRIYSTNNSNHLILKNNATATSGLFEERIKFLGWNDNENASIIAKGNAYFGSPVNILAFSVSASEKMSINHSGNVAISGAGIQIDRPDVAGGKPYVFWKSGGTTQASIYGASGTSKGLRFFLEGGIADFNDNIKASGVYLGGSGSANLLDDYEEGTWTPAVIGETVAGTTTYTGSNNQRGTYTKIGNQVTCWFGVLNFAQSGASGNFKITGLPFVCSMNDSVRGAFSGNVRFYKMPFPGDTPVVSLDSGGSSFIILWSRNNTTWTGQPVSNTGNQYIEGYVTYTTA